MLLDDFKITRWIKGGHWALQHVKGYPPFMLFAWWSNEKITPYKTTQVLWVEKYYTWEQRKQKLKVIFKKLLIKKV